MEGKWTSPSPHSEESSTLDLPSACDLAENFLPSHSTEGSEEPCFFVDTPPSPPTGEEEGPPAALGSSPGRGTEGGSTGSPAEAGLRDPNEPGDAAPWWPREQHGVGKALDSFYQTYGAARPGARDPACEAASRCLSQKISELARQEGRRYALRCLQLAQVLVNRDGRRILPNPPSAARFAAPDEGEAAPQGWRAAPGLSDDVLRLLCRQVPAGPGP